MNHWNSRPRDLELDIPGCSMPLIGRHGKVGCRALALPRRAGAGGTGGVMMGMPTEPFRSGLAFGGRPPGLDEI